MSLSSPSPNHISRVPGESTFDESFSSNFCLSSSCSSISSNASTISNDSSITPISDQEIAIHIMFFDSIEIISKRYSQKQQQQGQSMNEIHYKLTGFKNYGEEYTTEIAVMNDYEFKFKNQEPYGRLLKKNEFVMFRIKIPITGVVGIRVDLFHKINKNQWNVHGPITSKLGKIIARFKVDYFIAKPYDGMSIEQIKRKSKTRNLKSWQLKKNGFDIGHRGAGSARRFDSYEKLLENTIESFNFAYKKGADMVELDVQLSKDKIPIVYHDFNVNLVLQKRDEEMETFEMNIKDLTYNQLQKLKIKPMLKGKEFYDFEDNDSKPHGRPFASLRTVLESVDANCGFNVEIKYPQRQINGNWEAEKSHDLNEYVDLILQDLFIYAEERNILISSFHPEICSLVRQKQDRYPVLFLTQGLTTKWTKYENPLNHSIEMAAYLALSMDLFGVAVHAEDIIKDTSLIQFVKSKSLILFCWGDDLNNKELIENLKKQGVDGAIYDKYEFVNIFENRNSFWGYFLSRIDLLIQNDDRFHLSKN
ncbi:Glycerophosphocholine phosphodiesterase GPCPD1 [Sarcoptes scabiei]|uniref:Glycerophosphocholine phosphodiesterase GPCPD1 n=1 Tax=Sarcoptes scabiei TaxID=52283 RepID=A0A834VDM2_SARSC|nr:Glycerophosphocholine phosphodiesterase GPCPD1 [Sarcoptes scabiei]